MSRRRPVDNSTAVSLFPFLAVLLCTMGALLVVLVAVSRAAREAALRQAAADTRATAQQDDPQARLQLEKIEQHVANLLQLRKDAEEKLREDQSRLSHLEDHMRRLQDQLATLQVALAELDALEEDHYDDREQAQREIERLQRLIDESRADIEKLKSEQRAAGRRYALIPYEGPNGTFRRPLYVECVEDELILQPEGVRITRADLAAPIGPGNALASALRAARDYYVRQNPEEGQSRDTEPYPLLVVRPHGLTMYDRARRAIEAGDFPFGFELVEEDWELQYPLGDPQLAAIEQQAIEQARIRQRVLAAAAPRAYRQPARAAAGRFDEDDFYGFGEYSSVAGGFSGSPTGAGEGLPEGGPGGRTAPAAHAAAGGGGNEQQAETGAEPSGAASQQASAASAAGTGGDQSEPDAAGNGVALSTGQPPPEAPSDAAPKSMAAARGPDWALQRRGPNAVPVRRTIQIVLRQHNALIVADERHVHAARPAGQSIPLEGDTVESVDPLVDAVREQIDGWGIAGDGLYWRPVLILNVAPDAQRRADDLHRLLQDSGLELRFKPLVNQPK